MIRPSTTLRCLYAASAIATIVLSSCNSGDSPSTSAPEGAAQSVLTRGPVTVRLEVTPVPARLSDEPVLTITIEADEGVQVRKPPFGDGIGDFLIRKFHEPLTQVRENREIIRQVYTLEPTRTGSLLIDPILIVFQDQRPEGDGKEHRIETEPLEINVLSVVEGDLPSLNDLEAMADPLEIESPSIVGPVAWVAIGTVALLLAATAVYFRRRAVQPDEGPSAYEVATRALDDLHRQDRDDVKRFYVDLTGIVRRFIESTTGVHAAEQTTEEFLREISSSDRFERDQRSRLQSFLESADLVKFAAHRPMEEDIDAAFDRARDFIRRPIQEEELAT